jgi:transcription initiation factor TFIIIB Brf1 subunit/transcription initiation factor TFIIB
MTKRILAPRKSNSAAKALAVKNRRIERLNSALDESRAIIKQAAETIRKLEAERFTRTGTLERELYEASVAQRTMGELVTITRALTQSGIQAVVLDVLYDRGILRKPAKTRRK